MADNLGYTPGTGATVATDDVGGIQYQRVKTAYGPDGAASDLRVPDRVFQAHYASGNNILWTPAAGKRFRLMGYQFEVTATATMAVADYLSIEFLDGGAVGSLFLRHLPWIPTTAPANPSGMCYSSGWVHLGQGYLSSAVNNKLYFYIHAANDPVAALTAGLVTVTAVGAEE